MPTSRQQLHRSASRCLRRRLLTFDTLLLALLLLLHGDRVAARLQASQSAPLPSTNATATATVSASDSRLRSLSLGMGCPQFLSSFYQTNATTSKPFRSFTITKGIGYGYISVHFAKLYLPRGASIILRGVEDVTRKDVFLNLTSSFPSGELHTNVYAPPVLAKEFRIEFYRSQGTDDGSNTAAPWSSSSSSSSSSLQPTSDFIADTDCYGFVADWYYYVVVEGDGGDAHGNVTPSREATCAGDNTVEARCLYDEASTRTAYLASRTVARLLIQKAGGTQAACTGWLLGAEGHLVTNNHCIKDQAEASRVTVEFMAEGATCAQSCRSWGGCPGTVEAISARLLHTNENLDYSLLSLETNVDLPAKYGFLRLKAAEGHVGQEIYIPQHPLHHGKRVATLDDYGSKITILNANADGCATRGYSYSGDTQGGSSGSPVVDAQDHGVVALHHCGQLCANTGVPATQIISDLQSIGLLPRNAVDPGDGSNTALLPAYKPLEVVPRKAQTLQLAFRGRIYRSSDGASTTVDQFEFTLEEDADISVDILSAEISDDGVFKDLNRDCRASYMDAIVFLFAKGNPTPLLVNDDALDGQGRADGSISARDPFLTTFLKAGTYVVAIATLPATSADAYNGNAGKTPDLPELYSCITLADDGLYQVAFNSSASLTFNYVPEAVLAPSTTCLLPADVICAF